MSRNWFIVVVIFVLIFTTQTIGDAQKDIRSHNNQSTFVENEYNLNEDGMSNTNLLRWHLEPLKSEKKTQLKLNIELMIVNDEPISNYPEIIISYKHNGYTPDHRINSYNGTYSGYIEVDTNRISDYPFEWSEASIYIKGGSLEPDDQTLDQYIDEPILNVKSLGNEIILVQKREDASTSKIRYYIGLCVFTVINLFLLNQYRLKHEISDKYLSLAPFLLVISHVVSLGENLYRVYIYSLPFIINWAVFIILPMAVFIILPIYGRFMQKKQS